ncbi:MAG: PD-(D/E)XK nuclease family protein [Trueperaceae bacterium]|nr:PD-(D/E)XK nuclease family protein [Trueperaceae bacterium]
MSLDRALQAFTHELASKLKLYDELQADLDRQTSRRLNAFAVLQPNELQLSKVLGDLLDPAGTHGQGDELLLSFLQTVNCPHLTIEGRARIAYEVPTTRIDAYRRSLDLVVDLGRSALAIENKPFATEQPEQLQDYVAYLEARHQQNWCLVYLTPNGEPPSSLDPAEAHRLRHAGFLLEISYRMDIATWLLRSAALSQSEKACTFLNDLHTYVCATFSTQGAEEL